MLHEPHFPKFVVCEEGKPGLRLHQQDAIASREFPASRLTGVGHEREARAACARMHARAWLHGHA